MLMVEMKEFTFATANKVIKHAPRSVWSDGIPPPPLNPHILKRTKGNQLKKGGKLRYTAFNMTKFALARCVPRRVPRRVPLFRATFRGVLLICASHCA